MSVEIYKWKKYYWSVKRLSQCKVIKIYFENVIAHTSSEKHQDRRVICTIFITWNREA